MEPRARVSVWPRRRRVPGIVAPDSWGARGAECLPRDVLRHTLPTAVSLCNGPTACHGLCHRHGSGTTEARPPASSVPPAPHGGLGACPNICSCSRMAAGFRWALAFSASAQPCARTIPLNLPRRCRSGARSSKDCGSSRSVATRPTLSPGLATETCGSLART